MNIVLNKATAEDKPVIENLMKYYYYDFSEYLQYDVEPDGSFPPYPGLDDYWTQPDRFPFILKNGMHYAGFVLVRKIITEEHTYFSIAEFFILKKYRRQGIGKKIAMEIFELHKGHWEVYQKEANKPAQLFWHEVINDYTKGIFKERFEKERLIQNFENS